MKPVYLVPAIVIGLVILSPVGLRAQPDEPLRVACIGNSITQGSNDASAYPQQLGSLLGSGYSVKNFGVGSRTLLNKGDFPIRKEAAYQNALAFNPHILIIKLGTNDTKPQNWIYQNEFVPDYLQIIGEFREVNPQIQIYACRPVPVFQDGFGISGAILLNELLPKIDSVMQMARVETIDFYTAMLDKEGWFTDGIHPNTNGYAFMAGVARDSILSSPSGYIRWFTSSAKAAELNENITINWLTTPGSAPKVNGVPVEEAGTVNITLSSDTTFTLITAGEHPDTARLFLRFLAPGTITSFTVFPRYLDLGYQDSALISWTTATGSAVLIDDKTVESDGFLWVKPDSTTHYILKATGQVTTTDTITVFRLPSDQINRAYQRPAKASSTVRLSDPSFGVDGLYSTIWEAGAGISPWFQVDFGKAYQIKTVLINWGSVHATSYNLQGVTTSNQLKNIRAGITSTGGIDSISGLSGEFRYLRVLSLGSSVPGAGIQIHELEVFGHPVTPVSVESGSSQPDRFVVGAPYPNPFNPETSIPLRLLHSGTISIRLYSVTGQLVFMDQITRPAGQSVYHLNAGQLASGWYVAVFQAGNQVRTQRLLLVR